MRIRLRSVGICALAVAALLPWQSDARATAPARFVTGWVPTWSGTAVTEGNRAVVGGSAGVFAEVSPFGFSATGPTTLVTSGTEASVSAAVAALRGQGLPVVPSITDGTGRLVMLGILEDPATRGQHVQAITGLVVGRGFDGIDLDYEGFAFTDPSNVRDRIRAAWTAFVTELGSALHAQGKLLSVTVPPIWNGGASGYWWYGWPEMLPHIDRLRLMVYDWSVGRAGPVGPISWQADVIAYVKSVVPAEQWSKVQIGVNAYGRNWASVVSGTCPTNASTRTLAVQMESVLQLAADVGATPVRDASGELRFAYDTSFTGPSTGAAPAPVLPVPDTYANSTRPIEVSSLRPALRLNTGGTTTCVVRRTVYAPDVESLVARSQAVLDAGLSGIAIWALGYELPDVWPRLAALDAPRASGTAPIGSLDTAVVSGGAVVVSGWVADPEFDLPITFTVSVTRPGGSTQMSGPIIARDVRNDPAAQWPLPSRTHGFTVGVPIAAAPGDTVCIHARGFGLDAASSRQLSCLPL